MNKLILFSSILTMAILLSISTDSAFAHPHSGQILIDDHSHEYQTETVSMGGMMALEKSTMVFHSPEENLLPWAFVEGKIQNPVEGYPVIIQIFKDNDVVHFAQTNVGQNGEYEYKFRVLNSENGETSKIFEGDYVVIVFKVVYLSPESLV
jgi:ABC-type dipeptide/oligopeptide/nickel transport system ATPase subunit